MNKPHEFDKGVIWEAFKRAFSEYDDSDKRAFEIYLDMTETARVMSLEYESMETIVPPERRHKVDEGLKDLRGIYSHERESFANHLAENSEPDEEKPECLKWTLAGADGWLYGSPITTFRHATRGVHKLIAAVIHGVKFTDDTTVFRTCENKHCVNPEHVKTGSRKEYKKKMRAKQLHKVWSKS